MLEILDQFQPLSTALTAYSSVVWQLTPEPEAKHLTVKLKIYVTHASPGPNPPPQTLNPGLSELRAPQTPNPGFGSQISSWIAMAHSGHCVNIGSYIIAHTILGVLGGYKGVYKGYIVGFYGTGA